MNHFWDWLLVASVLLLLVYTMLAIKREYSLFPCESTCFEMHNLLIFIPRWWSKKSVGSDLVLINSEEPNSEIRITFLPLQQVEDITDLKKSLSYTLIEENLIFDPHESIETLNDFSFFQRPKFQKGVQAFVRFEGRASLNHEERVYVDYGLIRHQKIPYVISVKFQTSVLCGMKNGPYLEKMLQHLDITSH